MDTLKAARTMLDRQPISELMPYLAYEEEHGLYTLDTGVGFIFLCDPVPFGGPDLVRTMRGLFEAQAPADTSIQFMLFASKRVKHLLDRYVLARENVHGHSLYTEMAKKTRDFLLKGTEESLFKGFNLPVRDFKVLVSVVVPCTKTPEMYLKVIRQASEVKAIVNQALTSANMFPQDLTPEPFINIMSELLNPGHPVDYTLHYNHSMPIKDQIVFADTEMHIEKDHMLIDNKHCKVFSVKQWPDEWDISDALDFCGDLWGNVRQINAPFFITLNCQFPDRDKIGRDIQKKSTLINYQAFGKLGKWIPKVGVKKDYFDTFILSLENGEMPFYSYMNIFFYADDVAHMQSTATTINDLYRSIGVLLQQDNYIMLPLFLQALPMGYLAESQRDLRRRKTLKTSDAAEMLPVQADWAGAGAGEPVVAMISRRGQLQFVDLFYNPKGGHSALIAAATGAGKSFFLQELIMSYLGVGAKIWSIDKGRSFEKLAKKVGGDFVVFETGANSCLNPFSSIVDINDEMPTLKSIIAQMASAQPLGELNLSYIEEAIQDCYARLNTDMSVTDVAKFLENAGDSRQIDLAKRLYPFTSSGAYSSFFEGKSSLSPDNNYSVFELDELKSKKDLQEVVLLTIIFQIQQQMRDRSRKKIVVIDEAWDLLTGGNTTLFIEDSYRRYRKLQGACISCTQSVNDFYRIPAGVAIIENSDFFFLLRQRAESIEALKTSGRVQLSDGMYDLLKSVHTDKGNYSEIFTYTPYGITIGRLVVDRFRQLLYTTDPAEWNKLVVLEKQHGDITKAIEALIAEEQGLKIAA